jgi:hypothetical protein
MSGPKAIPVGVAWPSRTIVEIDINLYEREHEPAERKEIHISPGIINNPADYGLCWD